jgi:hypothetical protein
MGVTMTKDTTPEAVDAHIDRIDPHGYAQPKSLNDDTKTLLRALSAALEAERASHTATLKDAQDECARAEAAEAERDIIERHYSEAVRTHTDMHLALEAAEAERDCANENWETALKQAEAWKARAEAAEGKLATLSPLLEARKGEQCVTPDYIENVPYSDWPEWLTGDSWLTPVQRLRAAEAEVARLQDVLRKIADGRGVCSHCGREAEGVGGGVVMCADHHNCNWSLPSSEDRARAAIQKENKTCPDPTTRP